MKISLDTNDVKLAIREFVENRKIIHKATNVDISIQKLRGGDDLVVDIKILDTLSKPVSTLRNLSTTAVTQNSTDNDDPADGTDDGFDDIVDPEVENENSEDSEGDDASPFGVPL